MNGKRSNPCAWYTGSAYLNPGPFCGKQSAIFVGGKPYCSQHRRKAEQRLEAARHDH